MKILELAENSSMRVSLLVVSLFLVAAAARSQDLIARDDLNLSIGPNVNSNLEVGANDQTVAGSKIEIVRQPSHGLAMASPDGLQIQYQPASSFTGTDVLTYRLRNANGRSNLARVSVNVRLAVQSIEFFYEPFADTDIQLTVNLNGELSSGTEMLEMWADVPFINPPRHTWVQPGQSTLYFNYRVPAINRVHEGNLYYRFNGVTGSIPIRRDPFDLGLRVVSRWAGQTAFGQISSLAYVRSGELYTLKSSTPLVDVPATMDGRQQSFRINIKEARWSFPCTIEIRRGNQFWSTTFQTVPVQISSSWVANEVKGGTQASLRLSVNGTASGGGLPISLRSNSAFGTGPNQAVVTSGRSYVDVPITTRPTRIERTVTLWAKFKGVEHKTTLRIIP
ncbi:MAG: Ig-like domain-containing protein [Fimbriimonadaceae bacterium]